MRWERRHGRAKRLRIVTEVIHRAGWLTQYATAQIGAPNNAPLMTEDAAMLLVDQELAAQHCAVTCARDDVRLAFEHLTNPLTAAAVWTDDAKIAIVIVAPPPSATPAA